MLQVETLAEYGLVPGRFGLLAAPDDRFMEVMERFENAAGLPGPRPGGIWNKRSPWIQRSYLFITRFDESQFDPVVALARRGGFDMILMGQESWARSTGHYDISTGQFPGGLEALARTFQKFREAGFHAGLHFLGPSIYPPDPFLTPVPDPRLVRDASIPLAADVNENTSVLLTQAPPLDFPEEDGGYTGDGTVVQVDDELIAYGERVVQGTYGLFNCRRGLLGTLAAPHVKGQPIRHLKRSYGYFLFDMDTTLLDEVSTNFAKVANACDIDMIYFDGSERLQGSLVLCQTAQGVLRQLARRIFSTGNSYSHYLAYSARSACRRPWRPQRSRQRSRLTPCGATACRSTSAGITGMTGAPDMYEYILARPSVMIRPCPSEVAGSRLTAPVYGEILDLIARHERLRLSGRVPEDMRARLRIDPLIAGQKAGVPDARLNARREYRLLGKAGAEMFQRVMYEPWHDLSPGETQSLAFDVAGDPCRVGVQLHLQPGPWLEAGPSYHAAEALLLESFDDLASYRKRQEGPAGIGELHAPDFGATLEGVSHQARLSETDGKQAGRYVVYTAESARNEADGWSVFGRSYAPPLDLSRYRAIGFWMRGDGKGGQFKLQLLDGSNAADFYISNDFTGWRYQQLPRPDPDPIDFSRVTTMNFYYNGLPAKSTVACAIDDVKALPATDIQSVADPWFEIESTRLEWKGR